MTYEYVCEACGHQWETEQSIKDSPLKTCVSCNASKAKRLVSGGTGFLLKGGGWYADLYSSSSASGAKATDDKAGGKSTKAAEGSEAKPAGDSKSDTSAGSDGKAAAKTPSSASSSAASPTSTGPSSSSAAASAKAS
jgi:putative FmdB family regulatory protein